MIVDADAPAGAVVWEPDPARAQASVVAEFARRIRAAGLIDATDYRSLWTWSVQDLARFWTEWADHAGIELRGSTADVLTGGPMPHHHWFPGVTVNYARHLLEGRDGTALIAVDESGERRDISWASLRQDVAALAEALREWGVQPGDRVVAVLPNVPEAAVGLLAAASIGAVWSICAPEFGEGALIARFAQLEPTVLIAAAGYRLAGKDRDRSAELAELVRNLPTLRQVVWVETAPVTPPEIEPPAISWAQVLAHPSRPLAFEEVPFEHPLWVLFSSGTTGIPKGIVHGHGGVLLELTKQLALHGDLRPGDRLLTIASTSWVVWNATVSALACGATAVLVDGNPTYPGLDRVWRIVAQERVSLLGLGAGYVHACRKAGLSPGRDLDLSALRTVHTTGSPLSDDGFRWFYQNVGDVWLASMSGGTDVASSFVAGSPTLPVRVGRIQATALGVNAQAWNEAGQPVVGAEGELVITAPMPSMPLRLWGDDDGSRYREAYFSTYPGVWRHGDRIEFDVDGSSVILGRSDSTLNRNGIRLGPADIYRVVEALPEIAEALVVGAELGSEDYYMPLFIALTPGTSPEDAEAAVRAAIRAELSARYLPDEIVVMAGIPHTRTGKKLEVPVKRLLQGADLASVVDVGAVDDPELITKFAEFAERRAGRHVA